MRELKAIYWRARLRRTTSELCLLVYLLMTTELKMRDLLGWFNEDMARRRKCLRDLEILQEYELIRVLFPKKHQTYLLQWKKACGSWIGRRNVTFEKLRRSCVGARKNVCGRTSKPRSKKF